MANMQMSRDFAWVTLATNDSYSLGALVVAASLRRAATAHKIAVLITPGVSAAMRAKLSTVFDVVKEVNVLDSRDSANLALLARPELGVTFTKLHCWNLTQFDKCVFLDADTLVLQNCDELFEREELSAAPDVGWPDCFNSGVFVFRPSQDTFGKLLDFAVKAGSFDGGDQGLLNLYFADWAHGDMGRHLPFLYNTCSTATYSYLPAFKQFGRDVKILHFIGTSKPWLQNFDPQSRTVRAPDNYSHLASHLQTWWSIFFDQIHPQLSRDMNQQKEATAWYEEPRQDPPFLTNSHDSPSNQTEQPSDEITRQEENRKIEFFDPWEDYDNNQEMQEEISEVKVEEKVEDPSVLIEEFLDNQEDDQLQDLLEDDHFEFQDSGDIPDNSHAEEMKEIDTGPQMENLEKPPPCATVCPTVYPTEETEETPKPINSNCPPPSPPSGQLTVEKSPQERAKSPEKQVISISGANEVKSIMDETGIAGALASVTLGEQRSPEQEALESQMRRQCWEAGNIDYMGRDSFENILKRISETMGEAQETTTEAKTEEVATATQKLPGRSHEKKSKS
ncbi:glycogenin-1 isoform X5 [Phlebotomus argentipes]|uniref:glycogenin-1 isoform X5 n=1 Tax=Phlebotomus argentipes TaxID=94469 RepID=UPI0028936825|nr:glycogenin-1 isoform X5 [Phlebotomus argentipes]